MALVRLDRVWVAQLVGGLRVGSGSSCAVWLGLARLPAARFHFEWPLAHAHPQSMVCVLAKHQLCDVHFVAFLAVSHFLCDGRACLYAWGAPAPLRIPIGAEDAVAFCFCALGVAIWHLCLGQCGFDVTMRRKRVDGKHGFAFLVCERLSCAELGLVVR